MEKFICNFKFKLQLQYHINYTSILLLNTAYECEYHTYTKSNNLIRGLLVHTCIKRHN